MLGGDLQPMYCILCSSSTAKCSDLRPALVCPRHGQSGKGHGRHARTAVVAAGPSGLYKRGQTLAKPNFRGIVATEFLAGATLGPLLDGIHGTVHLLEYKVAPVDIGGLHSSLSVPILLGTFYAVIGFLHSLLDLLATTQPANEGKEALQPLLGALQSFFATPENSAATRAIHSKVSWGFVALNTGSIAALLYLSAKLYDSGTPYPYIFAALATLALANFFFFDRTRQGFFLAVLCALVAPASELVLINVFGLWQYPHPDIFGSGGVPSWVTCCYFFYTSGVGNIARLALRQQTDR